jgi:hypothetical protein
MYENIRTNLREKTNQMGKPAYLARIVLVTMALILVAAPCFPADVVPYRLFPTLYKKASFLNLTTTVSMLSSPGAGSPYWDRIPILANNTIVAFYGSPLSDKMGILGRYPKEQLANMIDTYAKMYDDANGKDGVIPAFYIIYGICWPKGEIGYLSDATLEDYIQYALQKGMLVFVDHQIGKYSVKESMARILPFLRYPNVHLALDPEWRTLNPMKEIGSMTAQEVNEAQAMMQKYIVDNDIPGIRMLVIHQFHEKMIENRSQVHTDYDRVLLVHTADGFGTPSVKKNTYALNARATNMPIKGFKLFFKSNFPLAGYDSPLLSPAEVMALDPRPSLVIYQ